MIQEQIVEYEGQVAAFVQTRGSMPFLWTQTPCIRYMPMPNVEGNEQDNRAVSAAHFHEQVALYGEQVIINLVDQNKYEGKLEEKFKGLVNNLNQVQISQGFAKDDIGSKNSMILQLCYLVLKSSLLFINLFM